MAADINKFDYMPVDDTNCSTLTNNIINYIFDLSDYTKDIGPAVCKVCDNLNNNEIEDINKVLNKFYNNLNE